MTLLLTEELLNDLRNGDERSYTLIFKDYFPRLKNFALGYVLDDGVAKNLVQDAFLKLWENRSQIKENLSLFSYLLTVTKNNCLDYLKHKHYEIEYQKLTINNAKELEINYYALKRLEIDLLDYKEILQIIEKTILLLPPQCQQVFKMSRFENLTHPEIANKLGIGQKAVEANITRALKIFRKELKDYISILILLKIV